jgi:triphosphoribosyl-dephospho-CoA synthase
MTNGLTTAAEHYSRGQMAALAVLMEITAPKPGNVHRGADFEDVTFFDFAAAAVAIIPAIDSAARAARLGQIVYDAIAATRAVVGTNTNLGTVLLLAPLALVDDAEPLVAGIPRVLRQLDAEDARLIYAGIALAQPGGMGRVDEHDVAGQAPQDLLTAMRSAAERDLVARQYVNDFDQLRTRVVPRLAAGIGHGWGLSDAIVRTHLELMAEFPDSLIARKCGPSVAQESADRASNALAAGQPGDENYVVALADFDFWLRSDHHQRNPGTTADLIAAGLFAALREGIIKPPYRWSV